MQVSEAINRKRAVRSYRAEPIPAEVLYQILDAGRRAQSSRNAQPWRFIAIERAETLAELARMGKYAGHLAQASAGIVILTPDPSSNVSVLFDAGQAAAYMQLMALELGVGTCIVKLHHPEPARALLGFPDEYHLHFALAVGYPAEPSALMAASYHGGRQRIEEIAFFEYWGRTLADHD